MTNEILILDIGVEFIKAGIFSTIDAAPIFFISAPVELTEGESDDRDTRGAFSQVVAAIKDKEFDDFKKVFLSIPAAEMSLRVLSIPFEEKKRVVDVIPLELDGLLLAKSDDMVFDGLFLGDGKVMAVAMEKRLLREYIDILAESKLDPCWIGSTLFSMGQLLDSSNNLSGTSAIINHSGLAVIADGQAKYFKPLHGLEEIGFGLAYLDEEGIEIDNFYSISSTVNGEEKILPGIDITQIILPQGIPEGFEGVFSISRHIEKGLDDTIDLRKGEFEYTKEKLVARKYMKLAVVTLVVIISILFGDGYIRYARLNQELRSDKETLREAYMGLFPGGDKVVDELYQLEAKVKVQKEKIKIIAKGSRVLDIMNRLSATVRDSSKSGVKFNEMKAGVGRITVRGKSKSAEDANNIRDVLSKDGLFAEVLLTDVRTDFDGKTAFSLTLVQKVLE